VTLLDIEKGTKKYFPGNVAGRKKNFLVILYRNCTFLTKFFFKISKFPNEKGTFDVNLVFTATLACTKGALFITKRALGPLKKLGGGHVPPVPVNINVVSARIFLCL
jgi:hypothetical protein